MNRRILYFSLAGNAAMSLLAEISSAAPNGRESFFTQYCIECHDADSKKGNLDLSALSWKVSDPQTMETWIKLFDKIDRGEMPPANAKDRPDSAASTAFVEGLRTDLHAASLTKQQTEGRVVLRRLNRVEYENTLHDLLAIDLPLQHYLPEDAPLHGFDNVAEGLRLSMLHMGQFLEAADTAIDAALDLRQKPEAVNRRFRYHDEESVIDDQKKNGKDQWRSFRVLPDAVVIFDDNSPTTLRQFSFRERGRYRIRISSYAVQAAGRPVWLKLYATDFKTKRLLGYFDVSAEGKREVEVIADIEQGELLELKPYDTNYDDKGKGLWGNDAGSYPGRGIAVEWIDVEGPIIASWPPPSVARLFGDLEVDSTKPSRHGPAFTLVAEDPPAVAAKVLQEFASRAFRRPVTAGEVESFVKLAQQGFDSGRTFEDAMRVAFRAVLTSPRFLFFEEHSGKLDDWALASRLSYFLGSTCPDEELRDLAAKEILHQPEVLRAQVERLLNSPKADVFIENFTGQWLELRQIDFTQPDKKLYPEFDDLLKASMLGETKAFFSELLRDDLSLSNLIHSDFAMLNRGLAEHYQIEGVTGEAFRRTELPEGSHRGGLLTQASVLKVTANGTSTSPVLRGAWVAKRLLGEPLPPPPADSPSFEPDTRGSTTIREQLAKHRSSATCAACHTRMDPPGFALENFDAIGGWRDRYRGEKGDSSQRQFRGRRVWEYKLGPAVDSTGELPDGRKFAGIDEFKQLLLERQDQVARNLTQNLLIYATGAGMQFADRATVEKIVTQLKSQGGGLRTIVHEIVRSEVFQNK
jgi:mono/diheme cytochrome c family protein